MNRRGSATVEFALLLPVLVMVLATTVDVGWYLWRHAALLDVAAEAARVGGDVVRSATNGPATTDDIQDAALAHAEVVLTAHGLPCEAGCVVEAQRFTEPTTGYELLTTRVTYAFRPLIGLWPGMDGPVAAEFTIMTAAQD